MNRDIFEFMGGVMAAAGFGHAVYAAETARGIVSVPIWRGREWGVGKTLVEAAIHGAFSAAFGYLGSVQHTPAQGRQP
ncbi:hypothetical protein [Mycobacterium lehmannii]|uniref:hypothetical protein n=1 Tax=Mycobacterium lehmannii TaxID=2048550 RepID=UPI001154FAE1|nr:hypothetical protein [Mycobacterium lehmannii]